MSTFPSMFYSFGKSGQNINERKSLKDHRREKEKHLLRQKMRRTTDSHLAVLESRPSSRWQTSSGVDDSNEGKSSGKVRKGTNSLDTRRDVKSVVDELLFFEPSKHCRSEGQEVKNSNENAARQTIESEKSPLVLNTVANDSCDQAVISHIIPFEKKDSPIETVERQIKVSVKKDDETSSESLERKRPRKDVVAMAKIEVVRPSPLRAKTTKPKSERFSDKRIKLMANALADVILSLISLEQKSKSKFFNKKKPLMKEDATRLLKEAIKALEGGQSSRKKKLLEQRGPRSLPQSQ